MVSTPFSKLFSASVGVLALRILGALLQLAAVALVGLSYSLEMLGLFGMVWTTAIIFRVAGALGLDLTGLKTQSVHWHRGDHELARVYARRDTRTLAALWAGFSILGTAIAFASAQAFSFDPVFAILLLLVAAVSAMQKLWANQMRAADRIQLGQALESVGMPGLGIIFTLLSLAVPALPLLWGQLFALILLLALYYWFNPMRGRAEAVSGPLETQPWAEALKLGASTLLTALSARVGIFFIGIGSLGAAGVYEISQRVQSVSAMTVGSVSTVFLPAIRVEAVNGTPAGLRKLVFRGSLLTSVPPVLIFIAHLLFGQWVISWLFSDTMPTLWATIALLFGAAALNGVSGILSNVLAMTGRGGAFTLIAAAQLAFLILGITATGQFNEVAVAAWVLSSEGLRSTLILAVALPQLLKPTSE